jgi:type I restriction enzyme S subunit
MLIANRKPLIFLGSASIDELSIEYRRIHKMLQDALKITHADFTDLQHLIEDNSSITYGIVKTGDPDPEGVPVVKVENMNGDRTIDTNDLSRVSPNISRQYARTILKEKDILVSIKGTIGRIAEVPPEIDGGNITRDSALIRLRDKASNEFMMLYLESELAQLQMTLHSRGAAVKGINLSDLREVKVPIVDNASQNLIVNRYEQIARVGNSKIKKLILAEHKKTWRRIDKFFAGELGYADFVEEKKTIVFLRDSASAGRLDISANHPNYTKLVAQIKTSEKSGSLSDLVNVSEERFNPDEHIGQEVNYLAIGDIDGISGKIIEPQKMLAEELPSRARRLIHAGDILVGIAGASTGTENMVAFPVTREHEGWVATTGFLVLRPRDGVDIRYVCSLLKAPFVLRQIRALLTSPAMPTISEADFMQLAVPVTDPETREKTLIEINKVLEEERQLTIQLEQISEQIEQLLSDAKSNIFDLLDDEKFSTMSTRAMEIESAMDQIEEALQ